MFYISVDAQNNIIELFKQGVSKEIPPHAIQIEEGEASKLLAVNTFGLFAYNPATAAVFLNEDAAIQYQATTLFGAHRADIKQAATQAIDAAYPLYKQLNLQSDNSYAQNAIAGLTGLTGDEVMQRAVSKVGLTDDPAALKATRDQVQELDLADIMADIPDRLALAFPPAQVQALANLIDGYFRTLVVCICGYRLIRLVRTWSNAKEAELATITDLTELEAFDPAAGCPDIA